MIKKVDKNLIKATLQKARESPRKRAVYCLHKPDEILQRMINAGLEDTYVRPHKHENPDKLELFFILKGKVGVIIFDDKGDIKDSVVLSEDGTKVAEIPLRAWHSFIILSKEAVLFEIIMGRYDPKTHKEFAPWAPEENSEESEEYLEKLKS